MQGSGRECFIHTDITVISEISAIEQLPNVQG